MLDTQACAELIFGDGMSTAKALTSISGRGMGMAAVRSYIQDAGGSIHVEMKSHHTLQDQAVPFRLRLELPLALFSTKVLPERPFDRSA